MPPINILTKIEKMAKRVWIRIMLIAIPVVISAIYTNAENRELRLENKDCQSEILILKAQALNFEADQNRMKNGLIQLSIAQDVYPNPKWFKSVDGTMLQLNRAYELLYLEPNGLKRSDYIGRTDEEVWGAEIAEAFWKMDSTVIFTGKTITRMEPVMINGRIDSVKVTKYLVQVNGIAVGVGGIVNIDYYELLESP